MRFKYHKDSGAFSVIPSKEEEAVGNLQSENKQLSKENEELKNQLSALTNLLLDKKIISKEDLESTETDKDTEESSDSNK